MLEDVLVANPDMLMSGLTLVGRQIPVETGFVDLVGIDEPAWSVSGSMRAPTEWGPNWRTGPSISGW